MRKYDALDQDPVAAGRELRVESVIDGSVQRVGDRVRVTVQLVSVRDGSPLWAEKFDEHFTNIFVVQDRISDQVARALMPRLSLEERERLHKRYTENPEAFPAGPQQLVKVTFGVPIEPVVGATQVGFDGRAQTMQFGASSYTVREGDGAARITVNRTNDLSGVATVDYATSDVSASERDDYITTLGTLRFEAGEATKAVSILIVDDAKVEGEQSFLLTLSNAMGGAVLGSTDSVEVRILDDDATHADANPIDQAEYMVRQHYLDFLNREPDPSGLAFWVQGIESCGADAGCREVKRIDTSAAFFLSIEFQNSGYLAHRLHRAAFGRLPGYREFVHDSQELGRGVIVGLGDWEGRIAANKRAFADRWVARAEFRDRYDLLSNAQYVDALFQNAGVTPTPAERDAFVNGLEIGALTRASALMSVAENESFARQEFTRGFVFMQYVG